MGSPVTAKNNAAVVAALPSTTIMHASVMPTPITTVSHVSSWRSHRPKSVMARNAAYRPDSKKAKAKARLRVISDFSQIFTQKRKDALY